MDSLLASLLVLLAAPPLPDWEAQRARMVATQLAARDITNPRVLEAMRRVPRHLFVPESERAHAYENRPLPIGLGQTISQPYIVAAMTQAIDPQPGDRVLEIGTGSGYQAAVLAERARATLAALGHDNVEVITGDGYRGLPRAAPFDKIVVTAAPESVPQPLVDQLGLGGRLVIPVGTGVQRLQLLRRTAEGIERETLLHVRFVPMTGEAER